MELELADPEDAIYREETDSSGARLIPSELSSGPWNPEHQHGGAVSALLARALTRFDSPVPMRLTRMTLEMFRGVPIRPLRIEPEIVRAGRRIQSLEVRLFDEETLVARATGLRIRTDAAVAELDAPGEPDPGLGDPPLDRPAVRRDFDLPAMPGFIRAVDIESRPVERCGTPATIWARLRCRFMEGEDTSPIVALASLVDFASGTGNALDYSKYTSINPDLSVHFLREPRSDWIGIRGTTLRAADGIGQSHARIYDLEGLVATVDASLLLSRR